MVEKMGGIGAVLEDELELARHLPSGIRAAILVEGESDRRAIERLAHRRGIDLEAEGVAVIAITGATNIDRFLAIVGPTGHDLTVVGMCDEGEADEFIEAFGEVGEVFVCTVDLEDELIRALGTQRMLEIIQEQGELRAFSSFQNQPDQRHKTIEPQMWRWMGNRKIRYASVLVDALDEDQVPAPLAGVLDSALRSRTSD